MRLRRTYGPMARVLRGLAWLMMIAGVFLLFFGVGSRVWRYTFTGGGLLLAAGGVWLGVRLVKQESSRAYVSGTVHVVEVSDPAHGSDFGSCEMTVLVDAPGHPGQTVAIRDPRVPVNKWPDVGDTLPALVGVNDARRIKVQWERVVPRDRVVP